MPLKPQPRGPVASRQIGPDEVEALGIHEATYAEAFDWGHCRNTSADGLECWIMGGHEGTLHGRPDTKRTGIWFVWDLADAPPSP